MRKQKDNEDREKKTVEYTSKPLFTGQAMRDSAVAQLEKIAEASLAIFDEWKNKRSKKQ